jgi:hypothetical protein
VPLVEQELFNLPGAPEFTPDFKSGSCYSFYSFICMFCRSLFVLLYFFFWPLCCLSLFDLRNMITPLVSSNSSFTNLSCNGILKRFLNLMSSMHMLRFLSFDFERTSTKHTYKTIERVTRTRLKIGGELRCSRKVKEFLLH